MLTTVRTANRAVQFAHKPNRAQPPWFGSPHEPHRDATVRFVGGANCHGLRQFATVRQTSAVHHGFSWFAIFFHAVFTPTQTYQVSFSSRSEFAHSVFSDSRIVNTVFSYLLTFSLHLHPLHIHPCRPSPSFWHTIALFHPSLTLRIRRMQFCSFRTLTVFDRIILAGFAQSQHSTVAVWPLFPLRILLHCPCHPFSRTIAFLLLSLTLSIQRSHFGRFCSISAFDGHVLAAFPLSAFSHPTPAPPFSHTIAFLQLSLPHSIQRSLFGRFCPISAFDGRILAGFAQSLHLTVAFCHLFLSPHSPTAHLPPHSRIRSDFCSFRSLSAFNGRILAGFAQSLHSMVAFWQLFLSAFSHAAPAPSSRIPSCFGSVSSPHSPTLPQAPVLAYHHVLAAFTHSALDGGIWQLLLTFSIQSSHFGSLRSCRVILPIYARSTQIRLYTGRFRK